MSWQQKLEELPYIDKIVNFLIGGLLFFVLHNVFVVGVCFIIIVTVALLKEVYDWWREDWENIDLWDTFFVVIGAIVVSLL
jgi:hypothetical protein